MDAGSIPTPASNQIKRLRRDAITQRELAVLIGNVPALKKLVVLDTCHAGGMGDALPVALLTRTRGLTEDAAIKLLSRRSGSSSCPRRC